MQTWNVWRLRDNPEFHLKECAQVFDLAHVFEVAYTSMLDLNSLLVRDPMKLSKPSLLLGLCIALFLGGPAQANTGSGSDDVRKPLVRKATAIKAVKQAKNRVAVSPARPSALPLRSLRQRRSVSAQSRACMPEATRWR